MLQTFWSVNIFFSLCLAFLDFCVLYIVKGKVQQKPFAGRDIEWEDTQGFGKLPTRENLRLAHSVKTGIFMERVPLSYACSSKNYAEKVGTEWNE